MKAEAAEANAKAAAAGAAEAAEKRRKAKSLYLSGIPIRGTPAAAYLAGRGIDFAALGHFPGCLAFRADTWNVEAQRNLPCLLAAIVDMDGTHLATHRTWLAPDGRGGWGKADVGEPKKVLGSFAGGFIPLWKGACRRSMGEIDPGTDVWTSEGIEDGLTVAMARPDARVIAAVSLANFGALRLPEQIGRLIYVGQRDTDPRTLAALERAIARQQEAGRAVCLTPPPAGFKDVNEALQAGRAMGRDAA